MSKRNTVSVSILSALALTLCLFSAVITAQKAPQGTASSVKPIKGVDVIVQKNPGNTASRTLTTGEDGEVRFVGLAPGNYSLTIVDPSKQQKGIKSGSVGGDTDVHQNYSVTITGAVGGLIQREWNVTEGKFATLSNATAKVQQPPIYSEKISFDIGAGNPTLTMKIIKPRSNVKGN